jgi:hypothetical protein
MITNLTFFACGGGGGLWLIIYAVMGLWIVSGSMFLANLCLLFVLRDGHVVRHGSIAMGYALFAFAGYNQAQSGSGNGAVIMTAAFLVPALVIAHCVWLLCVVRRERRAMRNAHLENAEPQAF